MLDVAIALLILMGMVSTPTPRYPGATLVANFDFRLSTEGDFNKPEGWVRYQGPNYPFYVQAELTTEASADRGRSLRFSLNGGNCAYFSPPIAITDEYNYVVRAQIKTEDLVNDHAFLMLEFLDEVGNVIDQQVTSARVDRTTDWKLVQIGPLPPPAKVRHLRVACVDEAGSPPDLSGKVYFDDVWIGRLPRFEMESSGKYQLFDVESEKKISIRVRGREQRQMQARFRLKSNEDEKLAEQSFPLMAGKTESTAEWTLPLNEVGFYHLDVALEENGRQILTRHFPITVMRPYTDRAEGDFGITFPSPKFGLDHYDHLLAFSATHWVKFPLWPSDESVTKLIADRSFAELLERLDRRGHAIVGTLEYPPREILDQLTQENVQIIDVFSLPKQVWGSALESILVRFGLKISHWQLGADQDRSFQVLQGIDSYIGNIRTEASHIGRDVKLGIAWNWVMQPPASTNIGFLTMGDLPPENIPVEEAKTWSPLNGEELQQQIESARALGANGQTGPLIWASIIPLSDDRYDRRTRIVDYAQRITAAKVAGADAIFASSVADPHHGLMNNDGSPTELFTVWRTLAEHLSGAKYLGKLPTPGKSTNHLFAGNGRVTMVTWSNEPTTIEAIVGREAKVIDLWGRRLPVESEDESRKLTLSDLPILVVHADDFLVRLQLGISFEKGLASSRFGTHHDQLLIKNTSNQAVTGSALPLFPREWNQRPEQLPIQILPRETMQGSFSITLPQGVSQGESQIPIDFRISAEKSYRFRIYRTFQVGGDELRVEAHPRIMPDGRLEIEAVVTNLTKSPLSLSASARALGRKSELEFISNLSSGGTTTARFTFMNGRNLMGRIVQIKFEDSGGRREFTFDVPIK